MPVATAPVIDRTKQVIDITGTSDVNKLKKGINDLFVRVKDVLGEDKRLIYVDAHHNRYEFSTKIKRMDSMLLFLRIVQLLDQGMVIGAIRKKGIKPKVHPVVDKHSIKDFFQ